MRVIIADDSAWLRSIYRPELTASGLDVVAETTTAAELIEQVDEHRPDACLVDISLRGRHQPDDDGLRAAEQLRSCYPTLGLLVFSVYMTPTYLARILRIGEHHIGYLGKDRIADFGVVVDALHRVAAGQTAVDKNLWDEMLQHHGARGLMSGRKRQTLELMAQGLSNRAIAEEMCVTAATVEGYLSGVFDVLGVPETPDVNKRVCAVLAWLRKTGALPES